MPKDDYWDHIVVPMPRVFREAANKAAHEQFMSGQEYCRRALLRQLEADGVKLEAKAKRPR
jgi:hypothetical protein